MARKRRVYTKTPSVRSFDEVDRELLRIQEAFDAVTEHVATEVSSNEPDKVVMLQVRYADGTNWNPGQGEGLYISVNGVWRKLAFA